MAVWNDIAAWQGNSPNNSGRRVRTKGLVLHIAEGSYEGTIAWGKNPSAGVSYHFVIARDGRIAQTLDTDLIAWTQVDGNGEWLSVEFEGHTGDRLTEPMLAAVSRLYARVHAVYGSPFVNATHPGMSGLGHHSMGGAAWGNHPACPGAPIIAQKPEILARAGGGGGIVSGAPEGKIMFLIRYSKSPTVFLSDGVTARPISSEAELADITTLANEGTLKLGYGGKVRVVGRKSLIGRVVGPAVIGFEDQVA